VLVHKLRLADVADAPSLDDALDRVLELLTGRVPVYHTAAVETAFLGRQFARRHVRLPPAADTDMLGGRWLRHRGRDVPAPGIPLGWLAGQLGQPAETPHHALGDALTTAKVFIALASLLDTLEPQTIGSLVAMSRRPAVARRFAPG
jgi:DNA polymerase III subunit epsilon